MDSLSGDTGSTGSSSSAGRLVELRTSAKGWHGVQLAVLGFIGLCGVLQGAAGQGGPRWLQITAGVLVLVALGLACTATALVATAAWPVHDVLDDGEAAAAQTSADGEAHRTARHLRLGIALTFLAVVVLAIAATSSWWPEKAGSSALQVEVTTSQGSACGQLRSGDPGTIAVESSGRLVTVAAGDVVRLRPVDSCG